MQGVGRQGPDWGWGPQSSTLFISILGSWHTQKRLRTIDLGDLEQAIVLFLQLFCPTPSSIQGEKFWAALLVDNKACKMQYGHVTVMLYVKGSATRMYLFKHKFLSFYSQSSLVTWAYVTWWAYYDPGMALQTQHFCRPKDEIETKRLLLLFRVFLLTSGIIYKEAGLACTLSAFIIESFFISLGSKGKLHSHLLKSLGEK